MTATTKVVHGDSLIYQFLKELFTGDDGQYEHVSQALLAATGIWLPPEVYARTPVLLPHVIRDPSCRGGAGKPDEWASPNRAGYVRDDNSLIKAIPRSLAVSAPHQKHLNGRRIASEFVAAHVWRECVGGPPLASRRPLLNSFVPNLVWLPRQVAKLSDIEGSLVQRTLQRMSWAIYRHLPVEARLEDVVAEAWALLPEPKVHQAHTTSTLNFFVATPQFLATREKKVQAVVGAIEAVLAGNDPVGKVVSKRYDEGLASVSAPALRKLEEHLRRFLADSPG